MDAQQTTLAPPSASAIVNLGRQFVTQFSVQAELYVKEANDCDLGVEDLLEIEDIARDVFIRVRTLRNAAAPVHKIPLEVLTKIFSLVPTAWRFAIGQEISYNMQNVKELCPLTLVCRYWRDVIANTPTLWSTMLEENEYDRAPAFHSYSHRCPTGPLYVVAGRGMTPAIRNLLKAEGTRVRELHATFPDEPDLEDYNAFIQSPLPLLERCAIYHDDPPILHEARMTLFPQSSMLRALRLRQLPFIPSTSFPALTALTLSDMESVDLNLGDLLDFLSGSPLLEHLCLVCIGPRTFDAVESGGWHQRRIPLGQLQRLIVQQDPSDELDADPAAYQRGLLSSLSFPPSCTISMSRVIGLDGVDTLLNLGWGPCGVSGKALHARFSDNTLPHQSWEPRTYARTSYAMYLLEHMGHRDAIFGVESPDGHQDVQANIQSGGMVDSSSSSRSLKTLGWFRTISKLWVEYGVDWPPAHPEDRRVLSSLPNLQFLVIEASPLGSALWQSYVVNTLLTADDAGRVLWPALTTLMLRVDSDPDVSIALASRIHAAAKARAVAGHPIQRLMIGSVKGREPDEEICSVYDGQGALVRKIPATSAFRELAAEWADGTGWKKYATPQWYQV